MKLVSALPAIGPAIGPSIAPFLGPLIAASLTGAATATDVREIELRRLFEPSQGELAAEHSGRIYIYEGLRDRDVERAMAEEFERVDSMMFIRVQETDEAGEVERDPETDAPASYDDGC